MDDTELLREYVQQHSEPAFRELVERHTDLVYSVALREVRDPHLAEEVTQAVFIALAQKASRLAATTVVAGWLFRATQFTARNARRTEYRRQRRIEEAARMENVNPNPAPEAAWDQIYPHLNEAMGQLGETDRNALLLRFFQNKKLKDVGQMLGISEDGAKMRVGRAVERLRHILARRGVVVPTAVLTLTISASAVHAAPAGLAATVATAAALQGMAAGSSTLTLAHGALKIMAWTKTKSAAVVTVLGLCAIGAGTIAVKQFAHHPPKLLLASPQPNPQPGQLPDAENLQGGWTARPTGPRGSAFLIFNGSMVEVHDNNGNELYQANFTLREDTKPKQLVGVITQSPVPGYVGKTVNAIYQIQGKLLTFTDNPPGNPDMPVDFGGTGAHTLVYVRNAPISTVSASNTK